MTVIVAVPSPFAVNVISGVIVLPSTNVLEALTLTTDELDELTENLPAQSDVVIESFVVLPGCKLVLAEAEKLAACTLQGIITIVSINTNIIVFILTTFLMLFISKFFNNRINIICLTFIIIYFISNYINEYQFLNSYELSKVFHLNVLDYMIGRGSSGIATSHILLILVALVGLFITNNNKTHISIVSIVIYACLLFVYCIINHGNFFDILFTNNNIFMLGIVSTDYVTSTYTKNGMFYYALFVALLGFSLYFINPIIALPIAILIVSLFNNLIDRKLGYKKES